MRGRDGGGRKADGGRGGIVEVLKEAVLGRADERERGWGMGVLRRGWWCGGQGLRGREEGWREGSWRNRCEEEEGLQCSTSEVS